MVALGIREILEGALEPAPSKTHPLVFFVGAGISKPSGVPDFGQFNRRLLETLSPDGFWSSVGDPTLTLDHLAKAIRSEVLMQLVVEEFGDQGLEFYGWLDGGDCNANHVFLATALRNGHHVVTTNVDRLIERAFGKSCSPVVTEANYKAVDVERVAKPGATGRLFKLHGTIEEPGATSRYASIRFTLDQVGEGLRGSARHLLETLIQERDFITMGYSGMDDFSVQPVFLATETERHLHWLQFQPAPASLVTAPGGKKVWNEENSRVRREYFDGKKDYAETKWEDYAVREILAARKDALGHLHQGHVSKVIHELMGKSYEEIPHNLPVPAWVAAAPDSQRLVFLAKVLEAARRPTAARKAVERILADSSMASHHVKAKETLARLDSLKGGPDANFAAVKSRREALDHYNARGSFEEQIEARLELVNALRRKGDLPEAWKEIEAVEAALGDGSKKLGSKASKIRRLLDSQRGLAWHGMVLKKIEPLPITRERAFESLRSAVKHAEGLPRDEAAALNSLGLVLNARAPEDVKCLEESSTALEKAFGTNLRIGNWQGCYQNKRNHAWARHHLSVATPDQALALEDEALELNEQAENFAAKLGPEAASGEIKTARTDCEKFLARKNELLKGLGAPSS